MELDDTALVPSALGMRLVPLKSVWGKADTFQFGQSHFWPELPSTPSSDQNHGDKAACPYIPSFSCCYNKMPDTQNVQEEQFPLAHNVSLVCHPEKVTVMGAWGL